MADIISTWYSVLEKMKNYTKFDTTTPFNQKKGPTYREINEKINIKPIDGYVNNRLVPLSKIVPPDYPVPMPDVLTIYINSKNGKNRFLWNGVEEVSEIKRIYDKWSNSSILESIKFGRQIIKEDSTKAFWGSSTLQINLNNSLNTFDKITSFVKKICNIKNEPLYYTIKDPVILNSSHVNTNDLNKNVLFGEVMFNYGNENIGYFTSYNESIPAEELEYYELLLRGGHNYNTGAIGDELFMWAYPYMNSDNTSPPDPSTNHKFSWGTRTSIEPRSTYSHFGATAYVFTGEYLLKSFSIEIDVNCYYNSRLNYMGKIIIKYFDVVDSRNVYVN